jgi:hypothetical protein
MPDNTLSANKVREFRRLRDLVWVAAANGVVIFSAIYCEWSLFEITLAYAGELIILLLVVLARLFAATRLGDRVSPIWPDWELWSAKANAIGVALLMYPLIFGFVAIILFAPEFDLSLVPKDSIRWLELCWIGFFISHAVAFVSLARVGAYQTLISDNRVMTPLVRYLPLLVAAIGVATARQFATEPVAWFYVLVLASMAVVNVASHFVEVDALRATPGVPGDAEPAE